MTLTDDQDEQNFMVDVECTQATKDFTLLETRLVDSNVLIRK